MAEVIRINAGGRYSYVPDTQEYRSSLERFAAAGMAEVVNGVAHLISDAGPLFWESFKRSNNRPKVNFAKALKSLSEDGLILHPDERLFFGKRVNALAYNTPLDIALVRFVEMPGIRVSLKIPQNGDIVSSLWPKSRVVIPACFRNNELELADKAPEEERCYVLDESCSSLLTVSLPSKTSQVKVVNPKAFLSWLTTSDSSAVKRYGGTYRIWFKDHGKFIIADSDRRRLYGGRLHSDQASSEEYEFEKAMLETLLASKGLGAILSKYDLEKINGKN